MAEYTVEFTFVRGDDEEKVSHDFDTFLSDDESDWDTFADEWCEESNDDLDEDSGEWECTYKTITDWDDDYGDPNDFSDMAGYIEHCELIDKHGQAYRLRYEDLGGIDECQFNDEYVGEFGSVEEWAQSFYEDCYDIPEYLERHIDWESVANDLQYDHSVYEGGRGVFIFRDC